MAQIKILLIEDNPGDARLIKDMLADSKTTEFVIDWKQTLADGLASLGENTYDVILLDLGLPDSPQPSVSFTRVQATSPTVPIIIMTGLDDEIFAVTTVRRGAQDYLVKGKIHSEALVSRIQYAMARKLGGEKQFTDIELSRFDGKEGRAAYFAFKGKVYDATASRLWKEGKHTNAHQAGKDLTDAIAKAPHAEDVIAKLPIVGYLTKKQSYQQLLFRRIDNLHTHTTLVHLTITCGLFAPISFAAWLISGRMVFDEITLYLLMLGLITVLFSFLTGLLGWIISYESKVTRVFNYKIALGILFFLIVLATLIWRLTGAEVVLSKPGSYFYLASLIIQFVLAVLLDYYGKKIVYA